MRIKVRNMRSNNGNKVANQFIIETPDGVYFQSYDTVIARMPRGCKDTRTQLDRDSWDYSRTTMKYLGRFLGTHGKADILGRVNQKQYRFTNLNRSV